MSARGRLSTALVTVLMAGLGFVGGAAGSSWWARDRRAKPWRAMRVEHEGVSGTSTRTRVTFTNAKVALQSVELIRNPEGGPEIGRVELRGGAEITVRFGPDARPAELESAGARATLSYKGTQARITFTSSTGAPAGDKVVRVPVELRRVMRLAQAEPSDDSEWSLIREAWALDDTKVTVAREVQLQLDIRVRKPKGNRMAQVDASCAPFSCVPVVPQVRTPSQTRVLIRVSGTALRSKLGPAPATNALARFKKLASKERKTANRSMKYVAASIAAVGVTALACRSLSLTLPVCANAFTKKAAGGATHGVASHRVKTKGRTLDGRALELYYQERARAALDRKVRITVCVSREGYARACTKVDGRPLGSTPLPPFKTSLELRRGLAGTLVGSFELRQGDGPNCKFSPSPKTTGKLELSFDSKRGVMTGKLRANERGSRPGLSCSLGSGSMRWTQIYNATVTQSFTAEQMAGGKLPLKLVGTMTGTGSYSWSGCQSSGGVAANCPGGRSEPYSYPIELHGTLDLDKQRGSGNIVVKAPLSTSGKWRAPKGK